MLNDEDLRRIAAEEHFRHGVRKSIEAEAAPPPAPPPRHGIGKRLFDFFNSSLGMWLLSSVLLTGGAAMLQQIQHNHEIAQQHRQMRLQHRYEIEHRLDTMAFQLRRAATAGAARAALEPIFKSSVPLTPELQNRGLGSLYLALQPLLLAPERHKAQQAMAIVKRLEQAELALGSQPEAQALPTEQRHQLTRMVDQLRELSLTHQ